MTYCMCSLQAVIKTCTMRYNSLQVLFPLFDILTSNIEWLNYIRLISGNKIYTKKTPCQNRKQNLIWSHHETWKVLPKYLNIWKYRLEIFTNEYSSHVRIYWIIVCWIYTCIGRHRHADRRVMTICRIDIQTHLLPVSVCHYLNFVPSIYVIIHKHLYLPP